MKVTSSRPSQKSILAGIVRKRKASTDESDEQKKKPSPDAPANVNESNGKPNENIKNGNGNSAAEPKEERTSTSPSSTSTASRPILVADLSKHDEGALKCVGILPGIGKYRESSDSEKSTDTDDEYDFGEFDWMGRKIKKDDHCE